MSSVSREIATLRRSVKAMDRSLRRLGPKLRQAVSTAGRSKAVRLGRKLNLSPERLAQLKLQGTYMGYLRGLRPKQKAEVMTVRGRNGMRAAIARAKAIAQA